jgi:hypothetical protein
VAEKESAAHSLVLIELRLYGLGEIWRRQDFFGDGQVLDRGRQRVTPQTVLVA